MNSQCYKLQKHVIFICQLYHNKAIMSVRESPLITVPHSKNINSDFSTPKIKRKLNNELKY